MVYSFMEAASRSFLRKTRLHILLLVLLGLLAYSNTFDVPFHLDDTLFVKNPQEMDVSNIPSMFISLNAPWASRPLLNAAMALNYHLGGLNTWGYHAVNFGLHLLNAILLYFVVTMTGRHLGHEARNVRLVAFLSALIFILHPVHTETVTNIVHRSMLLATAFYFSGLMLFFRAVTSQDRKGLYIAGLFVVSLLGMASREDFATFPVMLFLYDIFFISRFNLRRTIKNWRVYAPILISLCYLAFLVLNNTYKKGMTDQTMGIPPVDYFLTQFNVHWTYLRLLVLPINQNLDYDYPLARTLFGFPAIFSFLGYMALWAGAILPARRRPLPSFTALWFLVTLLPISFIVTMMDLTLDDVIFEHRLYLSSAGLIVLFAAAAVRLSAKQRIAIPAIAMIALTLGIAAHTRNAVWLDKESLWGDVIRKSPNKVRGYVNIATWYIETKRPGEAIEKLLTAFKLEPGNLVTHYNLGLAYLNRGMPEKAIAHLQIVVADIPDSAAVHSHMGRAYSKLGRHEEALPHFLEALRLDPNTFNHNRAAETYLALEDKDRAIEHFEASLKLDSRQFIAHSYLGLLYKEKGDAEKAIGHLLTALRLSPDNPALHFVLADAYRAAGDAAMAQEHMIKAEAIQKAAGPDIR